MSQLYLVLLRDKDSTTRKGTIHEKAVLEAGDGRELAIETVLNTMDTSDSPLPFHRMRCGALPRC